MQLQVNILSGGYGLTVFVRDVSFTLPPGAALAIVGRNYGKTYSPLIGLARWRKPICRSNFSA
jgi:ABC-type phosphonate transport system ATPase subunit